MDAQIAADRLVALYPNATYELNWSDPYQLLMATILAAQCTDERVNAVTPALFRRYPNAAAMADAEKSELETLIRTTGYFQKKAARLREVSALLVERHGGEVPDDIEKLVALPGIGRKTANVVLTVAFSQPSGVIIDTHGLRLTKRMGLTTISDAEKIEADLMRRVKRERWVRFGPAMVLHGRRVCTAHQPDCGNCALADECPKVGVKA